MVFENSKFRSLGSGSNLSYETIREMKTSPMILVRPSEGIAEYANSPGEKDSLVEQFNEETDLLLFAWAGKWKTDVFRLSKENLI